MVAHGRLGDLEPLGDRLRRQPLVDQREHLELARRQARRPAGAARPPARSRDLERRSGAGGRRAARRRCGRRSSRPRRSFASRRRSSRAAAGSAPASPRRRGARPSSRGGRRASRARRRRRPPPSTACRPRPSAGIPVSSSAAWFQLTIVTLARRRRTARRRSGTRSPCGRSPQVERRRRRDRAAETRASVERYRILLALAFPRARASAGLCPAHAIYSIGTWRRIFGSIRSRIAIRLGPGDGDAVVAEADHGLVRVRLLREQLGDADSASSSVPHG